MLKIYKNLLEINRPLLTFCQKNSLQINTESSGTGTKAISSKKFEEKIKKQTLFYIDNELPDKQLENDLKPLKILIKAQVFLTKN